jgi:hypothetical protein
VRQIVVSVTLHVSRRKRRGSFPGEKGEITDQVWLVVEMRPADEACSCSEAELNPARSATGSGTFDEQLREAVAVSLADCVEQEFWEIDDLSNDQLASLVANLPDLVKSLAAEPLARLASAAGAPAPAAAFGADVSAALLLKPVLEPLERTVHAFEVVGIVVGLVTGLHPLTVICAKHLAHDGVGSVLAAVPKRLMTPADSHEPRPRLATVRSFADGNGSATTPMQSQARSVPSPQTLRQLQAVQQDLSGAASTATDAHQANLPPGERPRLNTADDDDQAVDLSQVTDPVNVISSLASLL